MGGRQVPVRVVEGGQQGDITHARMTKISPPFKLSPSDSPKISENSATTTQLPGRVTAEPGIPIPLIGEFIR